MIKMLRQLLVFVAVGYAAVTSMDAPRPPASATVLSSNNRARGVCNVLGVVYPEGEFSVPGAPCVRYNCEYDGMWYFIQEACYFQGRCWRLDSEFEADCQRFRCTFRDLDNNKRHYRAEPIGDRMCMVNGKCHRVDENFVENCVTYRCVGSPEDPSSYKVVSLGPGGKYYNTMLLKHDGHTQRTDEEAKLS
ncbi:hypothetical protein BaRGS_00011950 [Batillaria attramentaria]|uniref:Uncharacterized protein n=1 Tax=Batillaria attramentaria TaxID=370345 RepID=A0ABD0LC91_9CAEN